MKLVIVESPTKAKTISKFLGKDYIIESSFGHVRDLPKSKLSIDVSNNFEPKYEITPKAEKVAANLKKLAKKADEVIIASDEDREGEAIGWHLATLLKIKPAEAKRIVFHEITKDAILEALNHPRALDENLFDAQQARRILDRLVGYELSPFLWKKVARGLSAGRVQSVALRLIVEREREILAFVPVEYWKADADFQLAKGTAKAELFELEGKKLDKFAIKTAEEAAEIKAKLETGAYKLESISSKDGYRQPPAPFKTSTLQQTANRRLGWSAKQTMMVAQKLYEKGFITYMRTDSLNLSEKFLTEATDWIKKELGPAYSLPEFKIYKTKSKGAQEAHEAIRPAEVLRKPESVMAELDPREAKLYELIWTRSVATQLPAAKLKNSEAIIASSQAKFSASGVMIVFDGFLKVYNEKIAENELPEMTEGEAAKLLGLKIEQHFTKPVARYSDATLVKELEKNGIGRPSTYAPTIATLETRNYIERTEDKRLKPTEIALIVNDLLVAHFPEIVDYEFTAKMERRFDKIAEGKLKWQPVIAKFYHPFHEHLAVKELEINKKDIMPEESTTEICDKCGSPMIIKTGRYGKFFACSNYPECKNTKQMNGTGNAPVEKTEEQKELEKKYVGEICDKCGLPMIVKTGKFGSFLGCSGYPKCKNIKNIQEAGGGAAAIGIKCPTCGEGDLVTKRSRFGIFYACSNYPKCKQAYWGKPTGETCPECGALLIEGKKGGIVCSDKTCGFKQ
ncbi:MAG: type I DNA topoisomerase [Candidatus Falkowbacteria bacterium]